MSDLISDWHNWKWVRHSGPAEFGPEGCPACEIERLTDEVAKATEAIGLLTTLAPSMEIDVNDPVGMAQEIARVVAKKDKRIEELERETQYLSEDIADSVMDET